MKILTDHPLPYFLAHGGLEIQIDRTMEALRSEGLDVEPVRWWDRCQTGDIIHFFGRPSAAYIEFAHAKGIKVVLAELHTGLGSRPGWQRRMQQVLMRGAQAFMPPAFLAKLAWEAYQTADACVALTAWEACLMREMFRADPQKIHIIPNGVEPIFFRESEGSGDIARHEWLVCTATIHPRKRVLELARAAIVARIPIWFIGEPYSEVDPYYQRFRRLQKDHGDLLRYEGGISDRRQLAGIYKGARGFVLLSAMESLSLSALEAAAAGCALLLSDLPWARSTFGNAADYCPLAEAGRTATALKKFYNGAPGQRQSFRPLRWEEVAKQLKKVYESL